MMTSMKLKLINYDNPEELDASELYRSQINKIKQDYQPRNKAKTTMRTKITLTDENPINLRPRRLAPKKKSILEEQIQE